MSLEESEQYSKDSRSRDDSRSESLAIEDEENGIITEDDVGDETEEVDDMLGQTFGVYNAVDVNDQVFEELVMPIELCEEVQEVWRMFLTTAESREAAGEAIYAALFDAAPSLQSLFKTPRAVMAMRFMNGINSIICSIHDPKAAKIIVETLGFQHLDLEVTIPRVIIFRDAIVDLLNVEMGTRMTHQASIGFSTLLNYVGGAYIYVRVKFSERLKVLSASWALATKRESDLEEELGEATTHGTEQTGNTESTSSGDLKEEVKDTPASKKRTRSWFSSSTANKASEKNSKAANAADDGRNIGVPQTYTDMFTFNAAVMGFGKALWMNEVLSSFDCIVTNVSNSYRLQEECDVLSLRMAKYKGNINLSEYKAVMLASLRSLVKDWGSQHEIAWSWLWENVERMLQALMGKPASQEAALTSFFSSLDDSALSFVRREVYSKFFAFAPAGQDYFKQSTTRLHFIADKVVAMTLDMYKEPKRMVEDISALGLRHVGYGIPTDLFGPFVTACVQVVRVLTTNDQAEEAFRWSLSLISRILTRVINEGSTIVMKAINVNSTKQLRKAVACAPRGKRALWMLNIQVGTQSISPLMWAIETGSLDAANAIIQDLLTIRADRDRYYYGMDILFERHPDILKRLCVDAPALLKTFLDGLIWRCRTTENGQRRVNYYVQHLLIDMDGNFSKATEWIVDSKDPKLICHPVVSLVIDLVWSRVAFRNFLSGKTWFLFTIIIFVSSQSILSHINDDSHEASGEERFLVFFLRCFIYICSLGQWLVKHVAACAKDIRNKDFVRIGRCPVPAYWAEWHGACSFILTILLTTMLGMEPILHCLPDTHGKLFTEVCDASESLLFPYSLVSTVATLLYFLLLSDLSVFSTRVSAYVLVCTRVLSELFLFLFGLCFFALTFACAISALQQNNRDFKHIDNSIVNLFKVTFGMYAGSNYDTLYDAPALLIAVFVYVATTVIFLLNLLIAQLNCSYQATYLDMLGYARLNRGKIVVNTMPGVSVQRWERFVASLHFDDRLEFGEGDVGVTGGIQMWEPASAHITTVDSIRRFGGSTSPAAQWPEEDVHGDDDVDRFDRMEKMMEKALKKLGRAGGTGSKVNSTLSSGAGHLSSSDGSSHNLSQG